MKPNFWFGLLAIAILVAQIVTGEVAWLRFPGPIRRDKSPRTFWAATAAVAAGAAYLIYVGLAS